MKIPVPFKHNSTDKYKRPELPPEIGLQQHQSFSHKISDLQAGGFPDECNSKMTRLKSNDDMKFINNLADERTKVEGL